MSKERYVHLLKEFGQLLGLPELGPNEEGHCCLAFDEHIVVHLQYNEPDDVFTIFCKVGDYSEVEDRLELFDKLLSANLFWQNTQGATLSIDSKKQAVFLAQRYDLHQMSFPQFEQHLEKFVNAAEYAIEKLIAEGAEPTQADDSDFHPTHLGNLA